MQRIGSRGFTLVELIIVVSMIALIAAIGIVAYGPFSQKRNDDQRVLELNRFAQKLEEFRSQKGAYVCGDECVDVLPSAEYYSVDCSETADTIFGNDPEEINGFLNGGNCCNLNPINGQDNAFGGFPAPTSTIDDSSWGLFKFGYITSPLILDPVQGTKDGLDYAYCYATPIQGRTSFALFTRLERSDAGATDGGITDEWYEILSDGYPRDGWWPDYVSGPTCGNGIVQTGETCDEGGLNGTPNHCSSQCDGTTPSVCLNGIIEYNENCELGYVPEACAIGNFGQQGFISCTDCRWDITTCYVCGDDVIHAPEEQCEGSNLNGQTCASLGLPAGTLSCTSSCTFNTDSCGTAVCGDHIVTNPPEKCEPPDPSTGYPGDLSGCLIGEEPPTCGSKDGPVLQRCKCLL